MTSQIKFKKANKEHVDFIYEALKEMATEENISDRFSLTRDNLDSALSKEVAEAVLAFSNGMPVGLVLFSMTNRNFDLFKGPGIYVHDIYVSPSARRQKIGTQLIHEIEKIARDRQCSRVDWVLLKKNKIGGDFYKTIKQVKEVDYIHYMRMTID